MSQQSDLDGRMRHLEDRISGLVEQMNDLEEHVENLEKTVNDFLGETAKLHSELLAARRQSEKTFLMTITNFARNQVFQIGLDDPGLKRKTLECVDIISRRYTRADAELGHSDNPEKVSRDFDGGIRALVESYGFSSVFVRE